MNILLHEIPTIQPAYIKSRPSKICKTPYVADATIDNVDIMLHTPSLGCCGLVEKESSVLVSTIPIKKSKTKDDKPKCSHKTELAFYNENENTTIIGVNPNLAEIIAKSALIYNCIQNLTLQSINSFSQQSTFLNSRFDFSVIDCNGKEFIMEIKNVPLADYVDVPKKERKKYLKQIENMKYDEKISYFPDGYRKSNKDVVSPRALKHVQELEKIATTTNKRAILCFVIQRTDIKQFQPSNIDLTYKAAVQKAWLNGVEIKTLVAKWTTDGKCYFVRNDLPICLFEEEGPYLPNVNN